MAPRLLLARLWTLLADLGRPPEGGTGVQDHSRSSIVLTLLADLRLKLIG